MIKLKEYFRKKFVEGYEGYEIVIALLTMIEEGKIAEDDILPIMNYVFMGNSVGVYNALNKARAIVDDKLIDDIIEEVERNR